MFGLGVCLGLLSMVCTFRSWAWDSSIGSILSLLSPLNRNKFESCLVMNIDRFTLPLIVKGLVVTIYNLHECIMLVVEGD